MTLTIINANIIFVHKSLCRIRFNSLKQQDNETSSFKNAMI